MSVLYLLDTCVLSGPPASIPNPRVLEWLARHGAVAAVSAVSVGELWFGICRLPKSRRQTQLHAWFAQLQSGYRANILPADEAVLLEFGKLAAKLEAMGRPQEDFDVLIAATALVHDLTLVTRNVKHFGDTGLTVFNPWIKN